MAHFDPALDGTALAQACAMEDWIMDWRVVLVCLVGFCAPLGAQAQATGEGGSGLGQAAVPSPPSEMVHPQVMDPAGVDVPQEPASVELGGARLRLSVGPQAYLRIGAGDGTGMAQLEAAGFDRPKLGARLLLEFDGRITAWLRLGVAAGADIARQKDQNIARTDGPLTSSFRTASVEGVAILGRRLGSGSRVSIDLGARLSLGGGVARWRMNGGAETAGLVRGSVAADFALLFGRQSASGVGFRLGYAHSRTGGMGPLDLHFTFAGPFFDVGFTRAW